MPPKAGVEAMTCVFAGELIGCTITVNAMAPGLTATALLSDGQPQEVVDHLPKLATVERTGELQDIAVVALLAKPDGGWINGQVLQANDGIA